MIITVRRLSVLRAPRTGQAYIQNFKEEADEAILETREGARREIVTIVPSRRAAWFPGGDRSTVAVAFVDFGAERRCSLEASDVQGAVN